MQLSHALNPRRVARSLVTVLVLTLIQIVVAPIMVPIVSTPKAEAASYTSTYTPAQATEWVVPANVSQITVTLKGGTGGTGGTDGAGSTAHASGPRGIVTYTFNVSPGDLIGIYPGGKGGNGGTSASNAGGSGGTAGLDTSRSALFGGGAGGGAGVSGSSGGGGGGGAASSLWINKTVRAVAAGAGGGGGAANVTASGTDGYDWNASYVSNAGTKTGAAGSATSASTCILTTSPTTTSTDGGGSGGSGGGYNGGLNRGVYKASDTECAGYGGSRGGNYIVTNDGTQTIEPGGSISSVETVANSDGSIKVDYTTNESFSSCATTSQDVNIYRVVKIVSTNSCTWAVPAGVSVVDFFSVGGGGGGGAAGGGGGGGGGAISRLALPVTPASSFTLTVGAGGKAGQYSASFPGYGLATTVAYGSTTFTANGGSAGAQAGQVISNAPGGTTSNGTSAVGFTGGAGGRGIYDTGTAGTSGTDGATGTTNYFYDTLTAYGGGGGGGLYANTDSAWSAKLGKSGGGNGGGTLDLLRVIVPSNGRVNSGGGGGGAAYSGQNIRPDGGDGADGIILIRYAIDSVNAFPSNLASKVYARYVGTDLQTLDSTRSAWLDSSGNGGRAGTITRTGTVESVVAESGYGSTAKLWAASGNQTSKVRFADLPSAASGGYTLFHVARYSGANQGRIFDATGSNWLSGFLDAHVGVAHHVNGYLTQYSADANSSTGHYNWLLSSDQISRYRANGIGQNASSWTAQAVGSGFGINQNDYSQFSNWQVVDVIVMQGELSLADVQIMEKYLTTIYSLSITQTVDPIETDTALNLNGGSGSYLYTNYQSYTSLSDTFTVEGWVKPTTACSDGTRECFIYNREATLITRIYNGTMWFGMFDCVNNLQWTNTNVSFPANEWHHFAFVKDGVANTNGSLKLYKDGNLAYTKAGSPYFDATTNVTFDSSKIVCQRADSTYDYLYIGIRWGQTYGFSGLLDEIKIWKLNRTPAEIQNDMHNYPTYSELTSGFMQMYFDFNKNSLDLKAENRAGGNPNLDLLIIGTMTHDDVKSVTTTSGNPYTTITFPRSYITKKGGWKVPSAISRIQAVVVGGGGGGGGGYEGGGGGAGGFIETVTSLIPGNTYKVKVGVGGRGAANLLRPTDGDSSTAFGITTLGGGAGNFEGASDQSPAGSGGSGGGGSWGHTFSGGTGTTGQGNNGGNSLALNTNPPCSTAVFVGAGGGGAGTLGEDASCTKGGNGGDGKASVVTGSILAAGGGGSVRVYASPGNLASSYQGFGGSRVGSVSIGGDSAYYDNVAVGATGGATNGKYATGSGGGAGYAYNPTISPYGAAGSGGSGIVALRYITASAPTYTKPSNVTLDVGQTETFTTNVAADSATAVLTRTFKWESTTPTSGGVFTTLKVGTGAENAAFGWVPSDTSTSGSGYLYRLTVTDSDTAGLFITDSSTAWATINPAMVITKTAPSNTLVKKINVSRTETYTITLGTPSYRATLTPVIQGISIDTTTAGVVVLKIAETATVGTWAETLTITDSVSASVNFPLSITVADPPNLLNTNEIVKNGLILNLEAGNSQSLMLGDTTTATSAVWKDLSGNKKDALTGGATATTFDGRTCTAPNYYTSFGGYIQLNGSTDCFHTDDLGRSIDKSFTVEAWYRSDGPMSAGASILAQNVSNSNVGIVLGGTDGLTDIRVGIFNGGWYYSAKGFTPTVGVWNHIAGTFNGKVFKLYVNGSIYDTTPWEGGLAATPNTTGYFIGRRWDGSGYLNGAVGNVRVYNVPLTETQVAQNYNATKFRFKDAPATALKPTFKYGNDFFESFTATSGYETKTVTFAVGTQSNLIWDNTSVPNRVDLTAWDLLNAGTYVDTITVTDSLGQSTYLPFTLKVSKADTLTLTMSGNVSTVYTGSGPANAPKATIAGLVGSDTATVQTIYKGAFVDSSLSCAQGGTCIVGNTGPGGGTVFYVGSTELTGADGVSMGGRYLEIAPADWNGGNDGSTRPKWAELFMSVPGLSSGIGAGAENTRIIKATLGNYATSANLALDLNYGGKSDWYMPSAAEMKVAYESLTAINNNSISPNTNFWVSEENPSNTDQGMYFWTGSPTGTGPHPKTLTLSLRPIRAFSPTYYSTVVPADVDTYTAKGAFINFSVGSLSNYLGIKYETSTLRVTQANQNKISINLYGANAGESFTVTVLGGSGPGAVSESVTAGGNASGCTVANHVLWNSNSRTEQKYCRIIVTKAASRNYFSDSITADVYFMVFVNSQPTNQVGGGSTIALNGMTTLETSTVTPPTITSIEWIQGYSYFCPGGLCFVPSHWELTGSGFGNADNTDTVVKFWRNKPVTAGAVNSGLWINSDSKIYFTTFPAGISTGRIVVITPNGEAVSDFTFTP